MMLTTTKIIVRSRVSFLKTVNQWHAYIKYADGKIDDLGYFDTQWEAQEARDKFYESRTNSSTNPGTGRKTTEACGFY